MSAPLYHEFGAGIVHRMLLQLQATILVTSASKLETLLAVKAKGCLRLGTVVYIGELTSPALAKVWACLCGLHPVTVQSVRSREQPRIVAVVSGALDLPCLQLAESHA